jgi:hypothetical protein
MAKKKAIRKKLAKPVDVKKKFDKEAAMIIAGIAILAIVFLAFYFGFRNLGKVNYEGLSFTPERFGKLIVYHYAYMFNSSTGQMYEYNLYLRVNPKENTVPISGEEIEFSLGKANYISINATDLKCDDTIAASASLAEFMRNNMLTVKGATPNYDEAKANNITFATCENITKSPVIMIKPGTETKVTIEKNCYTIEVANCEIRAAIEKFIVQSILDAKERDS